MPDIGFSEILLIFMLGLIVLGPKKLPRVAAQVGKWLGRARSMARQFREQLEEEINLEETRKKDEDRRKAEGSATPPGSQSTAGGPSGTGGGADAAGAGSAAQAESQPAAPWVGAAVQPEIPPEFRSPPSTAEPTSGTAGVSGAAPNAAGGAGASMPDTAGAAGASMPNAAEGPAPAAVVGSHDTSYAPPSEEIVSNESGHADLTHEAWPYNGPAPPPEVDAVFHDALKQQAAVESAHPSDPSPESKPSETNTNERAPSGADRATHERAT